MTTAQAIQLITTTTALITAISAAIGATYAHMRISLHNTSPQHTTPGSTPQDTGPAQ